MENHSTMSRRGLLAGVPAIAVAVAPAAVTAAQPADDPIFAVIAEHQAAVKARAALLKKLSDWNVPECHAAAEREHAAHSVLFTIMPTTIAGVAALLDHIGRPEYEGEEGCMVTVEIDEDFENDVARQLRACAAVLTEAQS